ncbi:NACHT domain-containing protein [Glycomyces buryatensis]|uniref:NACHT domain-containing protein n=1 Tax=Glycomyces buryatensis TaxID=2570927 RepID=A0A4S8QG87_9ACTN|nr:NACHT domain-containing protein [Glycomyces buryatensis]THV42172.1 NACHT domain-containing protein [Glycomyces buryatensis]
MSEPAPRPWFRNPLLLAAIAIVAAYVCWLLAATPELRAQYDAVMLLVPVLALVVAAIGLRAMSNDRSDVTSSDEYRAEYLERLADNVRKSVAGEIASLKLSGSSFIQVEWSLSEDVITSPHVKVRRPRTRDVSTLGEDWRREHSPLTVVLGDKGAGKSATAMLLAHQLLAQRPEDDPEGPVPVLLGVRDWNPDTSLTEWLAGQLTDVYQLPSGTRSRQTETASQLFQRGRLVAVLDGFDEIPEPLHARAIERLREALDAARSPIVLTSRIEEFNTALDIDGRPFQEMSVVKLQPIRPEKARAFLEKGGQGAEHWKAVFEQLGNGSHFAQALDTPLMVFLCREAYKSKEDKPDRETLSAFEDKNAVEQHLIARYLPTLYSDQAIPGEPEHAAAQRLRYLRFIAEHMDDLGTATFAWWDLHRSLRPITVKLMFPLAAGLGVTLVGGLWVGISVSLMGGLASGLIFGLGTWLEISAQQRRVRKSDSPQRLKTDGRRLIKSLGAGLGAGLVVGLPSGLVVGLASGLTFGITTGLGFMLAAGLGAGLMVDLSSPQTPTRLKLRGPRAILTDARNVAAASGLVGGLGVGLGASIAVGPELGLTTGLAFGVMSTAKEGFWLLYRFTHLYLWLSGRRPLPFRLMSFLEETHREGIFRQVGATYEFRHEALQAYLSRSANLDQPDDFRSAA